MAPRRILLVHGKAEASFAHSKRFAQYDSAVHAGASRCEGATEPRGSVWSARSLLPLWLVPRQHALWNRQDWKGEKLFLFQVQCQWAGRRPISARSKSEMLPHAARIGSSRPAEPGGGLLPQALKPLRQFPHQRVKSRQGFRRGQQQLRHRDRVAAINVFRLDAMVWRAVVIIAEGHA